MSSSTFDRSKSWRNRRGVRFMHHTSSSIWHVAWSPTGQHIATGDEKGHIQIWDAQTGQALLAYAAHTSCITALRWSPDGTQLASGELAGHLAVWEALTGTTRFSIRKPVTHELEERDWSVLLDWSPDGHFLATKSYEQDDLMLQVRDARTGQSRISWEPATSIASLCWSPSGRYLAAGNGVASVDLRDPFSGQQFATLPATSARDSFLWDIVWSSDERSLAGGESNGLIQV